MPPTDGFDELALRPGSGASAAGRRRRRPAHQDLRASVPTGVRPCVASATSGPCVGPLISRGVTPNRPVRERARRGARRASRRSSGASVGGIGRKPAPPPGRFGPTWGRRLAAATVDSRPNGPVNTGRTALTECRLSDRGPSDRHSRRGGDRRVGSVGSVADGTRELSGSRGRPGTGSAAAKWTRGPSVRPARGVYSTVHAQQSGARRERA